MQDHIKKDDILAFLKEIKVTFEKDGLHSIALFGSMSKDSADMFSDIDIAIKIKKDYLRYKNAWDYFDMLNSIKDRVAKRFERKCDIYDLDAPNSQIKKNIQKDLMYV